MRTNNIIKKRKFFLSIIYFFSITLLLIIILAYLTSAQDIVYGPGGIPILEIKQDAIHYFVYDESGNLVNIVNNESEVVARYEYNPFGEPKDWSNVPDFSVSGVDEDLEVVDYYDASNDFLFSNNLLGFHLPTLGQRLGASAKSLGLNIVTLGWYSNYDYWKYGRKPTTWSEVGSQTLDRVPIIGSIKSAVEADSGWDRAGHISSAIGGGLAIVAGVAKVAAKPHIAYVAPDGVTIMSRSGVPPASAFTIGLGVARTGGGYITPFKTGSLGRLYKNFARKGIPIRQSKYSTHLRYQDVCHWDAEDQILYLTDKPFYTEVLEELLHIRQSKRPGFEGFKKYKINPRGWQYYDDVLDVTGRSGMRIFPPHEVEVLAWLKKSRFIDTKDRQLIEDLWGRCKSLGAVKE